jgi:putative transcriptional regulator
MKKNLTSKKTRKGLRPMTRSEVERAAFADPDAQTLSATDLKRMKRTPQAKIIRRALLMRQKEF